MPPPETPSPHRFLPPSSAKGQGRPLPPSSLRKQHDSSSQQFRPTPRFSTQSGTSNHVEAIDSPSSSPLVSHDRRTQQQTSHDVELSGSHGRPGFRFNAPNTALSDDEMLLDTIISPKRKRQSPSPSRTSRPMPGEPHDLIILSSSPPADRSPSASPEAVRVRHDPSLERQKETAAPRFRLPGDKLPETPAAPRIGDAAAPLLKTSRPGFVLPPRDEAPAILPEVFSPHKKGSKVFEPGGMANTVRDWILALESKHTRNILEASSSRRRKSRPDKGHQIVVEHVTDTGTGVWTVHALSGERWLLIGPRGLGGNDKRQVTEKCTISLKPPTWHVPLEGEEWGVAIAWAITDPG